MRGASWEEDIGGITELITDRQGPALLFDEIPGYPKGFRVGSNLFTEDLVKVLAPGGNQYGGYNIWILVDDDIDVTNPHEVFWAIASRCSPEIGVQVIPGTGVWQLDPRIPPKGRSNPDDDHGRKPYTAHDLVINACRPYDWIDDFPPVAVNSPSFRQRIRERWPELFN